MENNTSDILLKEVQLQNNCPVCFSQDGLRIRFHQKYVQNLFFKKVTQEVTNSMDCQKCHSEIYPVQWTEDIERVHAYYTKLVKPKKSSFKLTKLAYLILVVELVIVVLAYLYFTDKLPV